MWIRSKGEKNAIKHYELNWIIDWEEMFEFVLLNMRIWKLELTSVFERQFRRENRSVEEVHVQRVCLDRDELCCNIASIQQLAETDRQCNWSPSGLLVRCHVCLSFFELPLPVGVDCAGERRRPTSLCDSEQGNSIIVTVICFQNEQCNNQKRKLHISTSKR